MRPQTTIETADLAWVFSSLCGLLRVPFDSRLFLQQFPPPCDVSTLTHAAAALGLQLTPCRGTPREMARTDSPLVALRSSPEGAAQVALSCAPTASACCLPNAVGNRAA